MLKFPIPDLVLRLVFSSTAGAVLNSSMMGVVPALEGTPYTLSRTIFLVFRDSESPRASDGLRMIFLHAAHVYFPGALRLKMMHTLVPKTYGEYLPWAFWSFRVRSLIYLYRHIGFFLGRNLLSGCLSKGVVYSRSISQGREHSTCQQITSMPSRLVPPGF